MSVHHWTVDAIGNRRLITRRRASAATGCAILGKAEFTNPNRSVEDRPPCSPSGGRSTGIFSVRVVATTERTAGTIGTGLERDGDLA